MKVERPYAYCCAQGGGDPRCCDCVNKQHGTAIFDVRKPASDEVPGEAGQIAMVADYNAAFDPADEAFGGAFRDGFREGWIFAQDPDGSDYEELTEQYGRSVDIEPSEAWDGFRNTYFAMLPLAAFPEIGKPLVNHTEKAANPVPVDASGAGDCDFCQDNWVARGCCPICKASGSPESLSHTAPVADAQAKEGE